MCVLGGLFCHFCNVLCVISSFAFISPRKRELVALLHLYSCCRVCVCVCVCACVRVCVRVFLEVPWVCLWSVSVTFPVYTLVLVEH